MCNPMFKTEGRSQERTSKHPCPVVFVPAEKQKSKSPPCKGNRFGYWLHLTRWKVQPNFVGISWKKYPNSAFVKFLLGL